MKKLCLLLCFSGFCLSLCGQEIEPFKGENGKYGFVAITYKNGLAKRKVIVEPKYDTCDYLRNDFFIKVKLNNKWGFINRKGKEITPIKYDICHGFSDGFAAVKLNDKWGYVNINGKETILLGNYNCIGICERYICIDAFCDGEMELSNVFLGNLIIVYINGKFGLIDTNENVVVPRKYNEMRFYSDKFMSVRIGDKWGAIDNTGKEIFPCEYEEQFDVYEKLDEILEKK